MLNQRRMAVVWGLLFVVFALLGPVAMGDKSLVAVSQVQQSTTGAATQDTAPASQQTTQPSQGEGEASEHEPVKNLFGTCKTCVFIVERIKKGTNLLLKSICTELNLKFPTAYGDCNEVLNAMALNGNNFRYWLFEGVFWCLWLRSERVL